MWRLNKKDLGLDLRNSSDQKLEQQESRAESAREDKEGWWQFSRGSKYSSDWTEF